MKTLDNGEYFAALISRYKERAKTPDDDKYFELGADTLERLRRRWGYRSSANRPGYDCNQRALSLLAYIKDEYAGLRETPAVHLQYGMNRDGIKHCQLGVWRDGTIVGYNQESCEYEELVEDDFAYCENV